MTERSDIDRLRLVLRANATTSGSGGLAGLVGAGFFSDWMGVDDVALTAIMSAGLIGFAAIVVFASTSSDRAVRLTPWISAGDVSWVVATVAVVMADVLTTGGNVLAILIGVMVFDFACLQMWFRSRATQRVRRGPLAARSYTG